MVVLVLGRNRRRRESLVLRRGEVLRRDFGPPRRREEAERELELGVVVVVDVEGRPGGRGRAREGLVGELVADRERLGGSSWTVRSGRGLEGFWRDGWGGGRRAVR